MDEEKAKADAERTLKRWCQPGSRILAIIWGRTENYDQWLVTYYSAFIADGEVKIRYLDGLISRLLDIERVEYVRLAGSLDELPLAAYKSGLIIGGISEEINQVAIRLGEVLWSNPDAFDLEVL